MSTYNWNCTATIICEVGIFGYGSKPMEFPGFNSSPAEIMGSTSRMETDRPTCTCQVR